MNSLIESLLKDPLLAGRLSRLQSVSEAATALVEAAAARGWRLGRNAVGQALSDDLAAPRELSGAELLAVSGGTKSRRTIRTLGTNPDDMQPL